MTLLERLAPRKLVLFRASRIGDFVCATPAFRAFRSALPRAEITLVALPLVADLAARCPSIDRFEPFPGMPGIAEQFFDARTAVRFLAKLQAERFDLAVQMHGSGVYSNPIALMFGARVTAGFVRPGDPPGALDESLAVPETMCEVERLLSLASLLGAQPAARQTEFTLLDEDERSADALLAARARPLVGVHPGARDATRRWMPDRFAAAATRLARASGGTIIVLGGSDEQTVCEDVASQVDAPCVNLCGVTSLPVTGAVIGRLAILLTNDSGPAHIAYALRTPTVTIFGGTEPSRWRPAVAGPFRLLAHHVACRPCEFAACPYGDACLRGVTVEQVLSAADDLL